MDALPVDFPTHRHDAEFWERLGRAVATYGFLEEILGKAIFSFTATKRYEAAEVDAAFEEWLPRLENALTNPLGNLIDQYGKAVREHPDAVVETLDDLLAHLREAARLRNVLCHGSWSTPDENGASIPLFVDRKLNVFDAPIDCTFLNSSATPCGRNLMCGHKFGHPNGLAVCRRQPAHSGSRGPGTPIWDRDEDPC